jgi:ribosomal protein L11 methyltransferase
VVKPSWQPYQPLGNEIVIELDPGMAFGTGTHQTTRLCLQAIEHCIGAFGSTKGLSLLDVGTGSGILAIAAALLGIPSAAGVDNDPLAVKSAQENARKNGVGDRIVLSTAPAAQISETFPIVAANILPHVLIAMREALAARVQSPGFLILSGIITEKASEVADAFSGELNLYRSMQEDEWVCLLFTKGAPDRARGPA